MLTAQLKAAPSESGSAITFPPTTAQKRVLPNGLTVIVQEDRSAPVVSVQAWCGAGSIDENEHLGTGLSHILEHMLFKGTKARGSSVIAQTIQDVGGYINAYTSFDRTVYWIDVPKAGTSIALDILSDAMMNSTLPEEEYVKEQEVIRREFAMTMDDPDRMAGQLLFATAYQRHPYRLPVIGQLEIFNQAHTTGRDADTTRRVTCQTISPLLSLGIWTRKRSISNSETFFHDHPAKSLQPVYIPSEPLQLGAPHSPSGVCN
jgi:zinc protease